MASEEKLKKKSKKFPLRPPVVSVMGHVDHGKTTLLSAIKEVDLARKERGGITQHIGAYQVEVGEGRKITFIDTPGHEAFTAMRARGGQASDIALLVVAADEGVKSQTVESIAHAKAAGVPIFVAINKIDLPASNPRKVKEELAKAGVVVEDLGGEVVCVEVSAKEKKNLKGLLEMILLLADLQELKALAFGPLKGVIVESRLDSKRGPVATVIVKEGTLKVGDEVFAGEAEGKVKAMIDDKGERVRRAGPSTPVEILGWRRVPEAGEVVGGEKTVIQKAQKERKAREKEEGVKVFNLILKADTQGSLEAIEHSLLKLEAEDLQINFVHAGTGEISESDVLLARASGAVILGFNVKVSPTTQSMAKGFKVKLLRYDIIYELIKDVARALKGFLEAEKEEALGEAEVLKLFPLESGDVILGCKVRAGEIKKGDRVELSRGSQIVYTAKVKSMKHKKEKIKVAKMNSECGILLSPQEKFKVSDIIKVC